MDEKKGAGAERVAALTNERSVPRERSAVVAVVSATFLSGLPANRAGRPVAVPPGPGPYFGISVRLNGRKQTHPKMEADAHGRTLNAKRTHTNGHTHTHTQYGDAAGNFAQTDAHRRTLKPERTHTDGGPWQDGR